MLADVEALNPKTWHLEHGLMPVVLTLTIVAGHYAVATVRQRRVASCLGWCVVALVGTGVTLYTSLGRQNDTTDRQIKRAEDSNRQRSTLEKQLGATEKLLEKAMVDQSVKCAKSPDTDSCRGAQLNVRTFTATAARDRQQLRSLGPEQTAAPKATVLAATVALFYPVDEQLLRRRLIALEPFAFTFLFEMGAIVAFSFAFSRGTRATVAQTVVRSATVAATVAKMGQKPAPPSRRRRSRGATERDARTVVVQLRSIDNQQDLADHLGVHKATVSRWMQKWEAEGIVTRGVDGRRKVATIASPRRIA